MTLMCLERERLAFALCGMERELSASIGAEISLNERGSDFGFGTYRERE